MPEPFRGEPADEYRARLREFIDYHARPGETIESARRQWVQICSRHEVASGPDFTADDPRPSLHVPSRLPKPWKPLAEMTRAEHDRFMWEKWCAMGKTFDRPPVADPAAPVTSEDLNRMTVEVSMGGTWGAFGTRVPDTVQHHAAWIAIGAQIAEIRRAGLTVDVRPD
ncbi:MAG: hypothetical protein ABMA25_11095 [Ilumatobacteraceae bacterium]